VANEGLDRDLLIEIEDYINTQLSNFREEITQLQRAVEAIRQVVAPGADVIPVQTRERSDVGQASSTSEIAILKAAIDEIESQQSQPDILNTLVNRSSSFAPRVGFFVLKNDHVIGWRARGFEDTVGNDIVREIALPMASDTVVSNAIRTKTTLSAQPGINSDDEIFVRQIGSIIPQRMVTIPLIARSKAVAGLYADSDNSGPESIKLEALEILARVAGMAVDLLAVKRVTLDQTQAAQVQPEPVAEAAPSQPVIEPAPAVTPPAIESETEPEPVVEPEVAEPFPVESFPVSEPAPFNYAPEPAQTPTQDLPSPAVVEEPSIQGMPSSSEPAQDPLFSPSVTPPPVTAESIIAAPEPQPFFSPPPVPESQPLFTPPPPVAEPQTYFSSTPEPVTPVPVAPTLPPPPVVEPEPSRIQPAFVPPRPQQVQTGPLGAARRYGKASEPDLPVDVPEEEKRAHNDARRFARLLVSEIKLYNEQKVKDGREKGDLYQRLREDVDRSRQMYDKRVAPHVAARFDYFHQEIINTLAEGDPGKMGPEYPGDTVKR
jgi:hypothetical protein